MPFGKSDCFQFPVINKIKEEPFELSDERSIQVPCISTWSICGSYKIINLLNFLHYSLPLEFYQI